MIIETTDQYNELVRSLLELPEKTLIGIDTETEEFDFDSPNKFLAKDLALEGVGIYTEFQKPTGKVDENGIAETKKEVIKAYIPHTRFTPLFQQVFNRHTFIMHNAKFDFAIFEREGFNIENVSFHDTMIMAFLTNENRMSYRLKDLAGSILKVKEEDITRFTDLSKKPEKQAYALLGGYDEAYKKWQTEMAKYCINDCKYTFKLFNIFEQDLKEQNIWDEYTRLELPFLKVLYNMEQRGIMVDKAYLQELGRQLDIEIARAQAEARALIGRDLNIGSSKQLGDLLFKEMGLTLPEDFKTDKGAMSTNAEALKYLAEQGVEVVKKVLEYRELSKLKSTYVEGMGALIRDGVLHTNFKQTGAATGRLSSASPNLQNIPRRDDKFNIRKAFIARPGYTFVISDYSQIELRLMAFYSQDPTMIDVYKNKGDIHKATADAVGCTRQVAKGINFGLNYGLTAYGLSRNLKLTPEDAELFVKRYFEKYERVKLFMEQAKNTLVQFYAVWTITKRKRRFPGYAEARKKRDNAMIHRMERQAANAIIQGGAADVIKIAMRNIAERLKPIDGHILIQIHDELICEVPEDRAEEASVIVKDAMENAVTLTNVPLMTEPHISKVWCK